MDGKAVPKVIDFGLAKAVGDELSGAAPATQMGTIVGTWEYMSPEQADLGTLDIDTRGDVYSLGVVLYELLTGTTPLDSARLRGESLGEILRRIKEEEPPPPSARIAKLGERSLKIAERRRAEPAKLVKELRGELDWIALRALEKDVRRRYQTAQELASDVK